MKDELLKGTFSFREPVQRRIYENLLLVGPGPAAFFKDASQLMEQPQALESTTHLISHLLREVESSIRNVLIPVAKRILKDEASVDDSGTHERKIQDILEALDFPKGDREKILVAWRDLSRELHHLAHRSALRGPRPVDEDKFHRTWRNTLYVYDAVLQRFREKYLVVFEILDELLIRDAPTKEDFKTFFNHIPQNLVSLTYFFNKCNSPSWLTLLQQKKDSLLPPEAVKSEFWCKFPLADKITPF
ncbi:MAG: hypothetical protein AB1330_10875 [Bacillota bacterium]